MRVNDSREHGGVGILPLQDFTGGVDLDARYLVAAARKVGREDGAGQLGRIVIERGSAGDLLGGFLWRATSRHIPAWGFVFGSRTEGGSIETVTSESGGIAGVEGLDPGSGFGSDFDSSGFGTSGAGGLLGSFGGPVAQGIAGGVPSSGTAESENESPGPAIMRPARGYSWVSDTRFAALRSLPPDGWPQAPSDWHGLTVIGTEEHRQVEYFHPTDPRLPLVHFAGEPKCSAVACDLDKGSSPDTYRHARLSSALRVIRKPSNSPQERNAIAIMLCRSGQGDVRGGYGFDLWTSDASKARIVGTVRVTTTTREHVEPDTRGGGVLNEVSSTVLTQSVRTHRDWESRIEFETAARGKGETVIGMLSKNDGGPLDTGPSTDKHRIGKDGDGNPINPFHISTDALYRMDNRQDARILFESRPWPVDAKDYDEHALCHLSYHAGYDRWMIWTTFPMGDEVRVTETRTVARPAPVITPPDRPRRRGAGVAGGEINDADLGDSADGESPPVMASVSGLRPSISMRRELMLPGVAFRPQRIAAGERDWRYAVVGVGLEDRERHSDTTPATLRMEGYGAQGPGSGWVYSQQPGSSRHRGGTVPGGVVFLPPELDMSDVLSGFAPGGVTPSTTYVLAGPGVRFGLGSPLLDTGGVENGWSMEGDVDALVIRAHAAGGAVSDIVTIDATSFVQVASRVTDPATPTAAGRMYVKAGALYYIGSSGTVTEVAPA